MPWPSIWWWPRRRSITQRASLRRTPRLAKSLGRHGFSRVQGSLYVTENEDLANLFLAIQALRDRDWFPKSVRDIRAFRIEQWSDFTALVKS